MTPGGVLDMQRSVYEGLRFPPEFVTAFFDRFFEEETLERLNRPELSDALGPWLQMFMPTTNGRDFLAMVRKPLYGAPSYQVDRSIVRAVTGTYEATAGKTTHLQAADLPSVTGFVWLDEPVTLCDASGTRISTRALSWGCQTYAPDDIGNLERLWSVERQRDGWPGVRLTSWAHARDIDDTTDPSMARHLMSAGMPLSISHSIFLPFGSALHGREIARPDVYPDDVTRWAHTLWMFMGTEIVSTDEGHVERHFRRRAERSINVSAVRVVTLRRVRHGDHDVEHRDVDWRWTWVVQSHPRHLGSYEGVADPHHARVEGPGQPCLICGLPTSQVRSYVKGPDGAPLKPVPETVYRVAR
jgi:hypothetical protein